MSMTNVFNRQVDIGAPISADAALLIIGGSNPALVQNIQLQYAQTISQLWEVGGNRTYLIGGRAQGTGSLAYVIGSGSVNIPAELYDLCHVQDATNSIMFSFNTGCSTATTATPGVSTTISGTLVTAIAYTTAANDMIVTKQLQLMFLSMV